MPLGVYLAKVSRISTGSSAVKGTPFVRVDLEYKDAAGNKQGIHKNIYISVGNPKALKISRAQLKAIGLDPDAESFSDDIQTPDSCSGNKVEIHIEENDSGYEEIRRIQLPSEQWSEGITTDIRDALRSVGSGEKSEDEYPF